MFVAEPSVVSSSSGNSAQRTLKKLIHERLLRKIKFTKTAVIAIAPEVILFIYHLDALVLACGRVVEPSFFNLKADLGPRAIKTKIWKQIQY